MYILKYLGIHAQKDKCHISVCYVQADIVDLTCVPAYSGEQVILDKDGNHLNVNLW